MGRLRLWLPIISGARLRLAPLIRNYCQLCGNLLGVSLGIEGDWCWRLCRSRRLNEDGSSILFWFVDVVFICFSFYFGYLFIIIYVLLLIIVDLFSCCPLIIIFILIINLIFTFPSLTLPTNLNRPDRSLHTNSAQKPS